MELSRTRCDRHLLGTIVVLSLIIPIQRLGIDRGTEISGPTPVVIGIVGSIGATFAALAFFCSKSIVSRSASAENNSATQLAAAKWLLSACIWTSLAFIASSYLSFTYLRIVSEYLPGTNSPEFGKIISDNRNTWWRSRCHRFLDVLMEDGKFLHFCQISAWDKSIGDRKVTVGDEVSVEIRRTNFFSVVKNIQPATY